MYCLLCDSQFEGFSEHGIPQKVGKCPFCGAKARHRSIALFLKKYFAIKADNKHAPLHVLEVGPSKVTVKKLIQSRFIGDSRWTFIDIRRRNILPPHEFIEMNVCEMAFRDGFFDLIICNNVLPYILDFSKALNEIYRCLKDSGLGVLNNYLTDSDETVSAKALQRMNPDLYNEDYLSENGTEWYFGQDYYELLCRRNFFPLKWLFHAYDDREFLIENGLNFSTEFSLVFKSQLRADTYSSEIPTNSVLYPP